MSRLKILKNNQGFTLAELLVAVIIGLLILITVTTVFSLNQKILRKSNIKSELLQNARIATDIMTREIRQAKQIVTVLPIDNSNLNLVPHELEFEDGHNVNQIQYVRYYINGNQLKRQIKVYYFESDPQIYVYWNDTDAFGSPEQSVIDEKIIGEYFSEINFYGQDKIYIDLILDKQTEQIKIKSEVKPRNI